MNKVTLFFLLIVEGAPNILSFLFFLCNVVVMKRSSTDFGSFSHWFSGEPSKSSTQVKSKSRKLDDVQTADIDRPPRKVPSHPLQASELQPENDEKKQQLDRHRDTDIRLINEAQAQTVVECKSNPDPELLITERLDKKLKGYEMTTKMITEYMRMIADGSVDCGYSFGTSLQPHANDNNWEPCESQLEKLVQKYERERVELESILSGLVASLIRGTNEIERTGTDQVETKVNGDDLLSEAVEFALKVILNSRRRLAQWIETI